MWPVNRGQKPEGNQKDRRYAGCYSFYTRSKWVWRQLFTIEGHHVTSFKRLLAAGCGAVLLCGIVYASAAAQGFNNSKTAFTFNRAVELPGGRTLQPGKYVFRLVDSSAGRHIVQVLDEDETTVLATILAVDPREEAVILGDTPATAARPIRYWYHSGREVGPIGYEFVYPKDQANRIANMTHQRVLMMEADVNDAEGMMRARLQTVDPNRAVAEYREHTPPQARTTSAAATSRELNPPGPVRSADVRTESPQLAGVESVTLIGLTLLGVALLVALRVHNRTSPRPL